MIKSIGMIKTKSLPLRKISIGLVLLISFYHSGFSQNIKGEEILGRPSDKSMTVQMFFDDSIEIKIQYGLVSGIYDRETNKCGYIYSCRNNCF